MKTRVLLAIAGLVTMFGAACGGGGSTTGSTPVQAAPTKAVVAFNLDPNPQNAEYQGSGWWKFRVNLEFVESAGVGFTINSVRYTIVNPSNGAILVDRDESVAERVAGNGRKVMQFASTNYYVAYGLSGRVDAKFIANITDDKGNTIALSNQVTVMQAGGPKVELPQ